MLSTHLWKEPKGIPTVLAQGSTENSAKVEEYSRVVEVQ